MLSSQGFSFMTLLDVLQNLSLAAMFAVTLAIGLVLSGLVVVAVRFGVQKSGFSPTTILPMRDTLIGAISALFALMVAFSAAGIWNDTSQANTAVQRESNALENMLALAPSLPADLAEKLKAGVNAYTRQVVEKDWPAMIGKAAVDDPVYEAGDAILLGLINMLSVELSRIAGLPTATTRSPDHWAQRAARAHHHRGRRRVGGAVDRHAADRRRDSGGRAMPQPSLPGRRCWRSASMRWSRRGLLRHPGATGRSSAHCQ